MLTRTIRTVLAAAVAVPMMIAVQGCTDEEVLGTLAGAAIVGGAVAIGVAAGNNNHRDDRRDDRHDDRRGRDRGGWDRDNRFSAKIDVALPDDMTSSEIETATGPIPDAIAERFNATFRTAVATNSLQPIYALGISRPDIENLAHLQMISDSSVNALAGQLNISNVQAREMVGQVLVDMKVKSLNAVAGF
jgi:hypothetical protein